MAAWTRPGIKGPMLLVSEPCRNSLRVFRSIIFKAPVCQSNRMFFRQIEIPTTWLLMQTAKNVELEKNHHRGSATSSKCLAFSSSRNQSTTTLFTGIHSLLFSVAHKAFPTFRNIGLLYHGNTSYNFPEN